ncbi:oxidoreductase [Ameyamaea chiangmaiensis NBRC 103196]|uniref:TIGR01244 family phosphatase n=1 Tax=Ameyamaea chiangmaiensis TaxID=442969 RepID=A0A850PJK4_9PROT|nr:TIGR01244 family sulfur transferase [Ameyamaea chiangmaiensis]MBS4075640.1 TIGR01244 family phosphatase [Ameyamaea chiangmaiensis]NVN41982.1 TIGR01244 family phosphatase [Ameyamaea chiangmaiensis]GBQ70674.1 oxidoreductase [Ameyamaea chiangmaiensis NBRC 103196]
MFSKLRSLLHGRTPAPDQPFKARPLSDDFAVCPQIAADDAAAIAAAGFATVVCMRPDHEEPGQPTAAHIGQACADAGLAFAFLPTPVGASGDVQELRAVLSSHPAPVLAYCRSGARAARLWEAARTGERS